MGEVNFLALVVGVILGPIAITWGALAFFLFMSRADESNSKGENE